MENKQYGVKYRARIDGKLRVFYYIETPHMNVIKLDGEHTYLWEHDKRIDQTSIAKAF